MSEQFEKSVNTDTRYAISIYAALIIAETYDQCKQNNTKETIEIETVYLLTHGMIRAHYI